MLWFVSYSVCTCSWCCHMTWDSSSKSHSRCTKSCFPSKLCQFDKSLCWLQEQLWTNYHLWTRWSPSVEKMQRWRRRHAQLFETQLSSGAFDTLSLALWFCLDALRTGASRQRAPGRCPRQLVSILSFKQCQRHETAKCEGLPIDLSSWPRRPR